jgi:BlaI family penicillinase repressor
MTGGVGGFVRNDAQRYPLVEKNAYRSFYLKSMIGTYFGGSFERLVSFFAKDNDMDIDEMEELLKNVQNDIKDPRDE